MVKDGVLDALIVVGATAKAEDTLAAVDIASNVPYQTSASGGSVSVSGDAWMVGTSSKFLEMANSNATSSSIHGESFRSITNFIGEDELGALEDGSWSTNENNYEFQQFMFFDEEGEAGQPKNRIVKYTEDDDDETADHLFFKSGQQIARYKLEFSSTAQSDVTDSSGSADTTGTYLDDFENTDLSFLGNDYSVVLARRTSSGATAYQNGMKLTLMAGSTRDTLLEGESKTYTVGDKTYDVTLSFTDDDEAKFIVNGESTSKLKVGETFILKDKSEIGVSEVLYQSYAGGVHSSTFFVGAQKLVLQDDDISAIGTGEYNMKMGSEDIDGTNVFITGTDNNVTATISTIEVNMTADSDYFVAAGESLAQVIDAEDDEEEVLMGGAFDIEYKGLTEEESHDLKLRSSSSKRYKLHLYDGDGNAVDLPVAYANAEFNLTMGEEDWEGVSRANQKRLILTEGTAGSGGSNVYEGDNIYKDDYFVVTSGTAADGSAKSYLLQYKGADKQTKSTPKIKFKNMGSGETLEYSVTSQTATGTVATIKLGGYSFIVQNASVMSADDFQVDVDLDGGGSVGSNTVNFIDSHGSQWQLTNNNLNSSHPALAAANQTYVEWTMSVPNGDDYDNVVPSSIVLNITSSSDPEVRAALTGVTLVTPDGESEISYGYTSTGGLITFEQPSSDPDEFTINYPAEQRLPQVYLTSGATKTVKKSGKTATATVVDATKLDTEVASLWAQNTILVGGPCVNSLSAEALGNPAQCAEGFSAGKAKVQMLESNGKVAMLVAGFSGADTRCAGKVLAHRASELSGEEVEVTCTGLKYSTATISAPVKEVAAAPASE